jgi:hypothetical protein
MPSSLSVTSPLVSFTVTNLNDSGPGSLRQAIIDANTALGADVITFNVTGTITLTTGQLVISDTLTINGPGASSLTISSSNAIRIFEISTGATVGISGMMIKTSNGIAVLNRGTVTVIHSILSDSHFGLINESGMVTITNCTISNNHSTGHGGGIFNLSGTVIVTNSTISNNTAPLNGGGIANFSGMLTITNSTVSNNTGFEGGGIGNENNGTVTVTNCTLSGNSTIGGGGGGIVIGSGTGNITNTTITNNSAYAGGGIRNFGTVNVKNSIVANNTLILNPPKYGGDCGNLGTLNALGTNITTDGSCFGFTQVTPAQINLGPLQVNAPGMTATHALLPGSVAIDAVTDCTDVGGNPIATDQRGISRPQDGDGDGVSRCDLGAFELLTFDLCIQDDSNNSILKINSATGDYQFTTCSGNILGGKGNLIVKGSLITLQHYVADRKVLARIDSSVKKGTASIQVFGQGTTFTIIDRNTANNICACALR